MPEQRRPFVYTPLAIAGAEGLALGALSAFGDQLPAWRMGAAKLALFATGLMGELMFPEHMSANVNYTLMATSLFSLTQQIPWALKLNEPGAIFAKVAGDTGMLPTDTALPALSLNRAACTGCAGKAAPYPVGPQDGVTQAPGALAYAVGPQNGVTQAPGALAAIGSDGVTQNSGWNPPIAGGHPGSWQPDIGGVGVDFAAGGIDRSVGRAQAPGSIA
jgi:hypothetical protein